MIDPRVQALADEFGVRIIGKHRYPEPGETRAVATIGRIIDRHGVEHARLVFTVLRQTDNNFGLLDEAALWMASDMVRQRGADEVNDEWLGAWDKIPIGQLQWVSSRLQGVVPQRFALGGMVYERLYRRVERDNPDQLDWLDDRRIA
jgi:hypothetical protein